MSIYRKFFGLVILCFVSLLVSAQPRYIFYLIGDGMGVNQVLAAEMYRAELNGAIGRERLVMSQFPYAGLCSTFSLSNGITDSSAAGTCLATGQKTENGRLGTAPDGRAIPTIAEQLKADGWGVGIMTSVAIDHATPGAFYAHVNSRSDYYKIGTQLAESGFDFFGGAGFHQPENKREWNAPNLYDYCEQQGYTFAHGYADAQTKLGAEKLVLVQANDGVDRTKKSESIPYAIDRDSSDLTLAQITETAISYLSAKHDRFFMMVEGGKIDYAGHGKDGATNILETLDFNEAIRLCYRFYCQHPDETLIVVTADHETGGMALGNKDYQLNLQILQHQHVSSWVLGVHIRDLHKQFGKKLKWEQVRELLQKDLDFYNGVELNEYEESQLKEAYKKVISGKQKTTKTLYQDIDELGGKAISILNYKSRLGWTTYSHTASPVPVFAIGNGAEQFSGFHDNSDLAPLILKLAAP